MSDHEHGHDGGEDAENAPAEDAEKTAGSHPNHGSEEEKEACEFC